MFMVNEFTETIHKYWHIKGLLISVSHVQFSVKGNPCFDLNTYINTNCKSESEFCFPILDVLQLKQESGEECLWTSIEMQAFPVAASAR